MEKKVKTILAVAREKDVNTFFYARFVQNASKAVAFLNITTHHIQADQQTATKRRESGKHALESTACGIFGGCMGKS